MIIDILICALAIMMYVSVLVITALLMLDYNPDNAKLWYVTWDKED